MKKKLLVVISNYKPRGIAKTSELVRSILRVHSDVFLVVNDDGVTTPQLFIDERSFGLPVHCLVRPNLGMNIGAWDAAWKAVPEYDFYLFLQDECELLDPGFVDAYSARLSIERVGMVGERANPKWDKTWSDLQDLPLNYPVAVDRRTGRQVSRVEFYLEKMRVWGIDPGCSGRHLSSLVWGFSAGCLSAIGGFPTGINKEECIAAEIAVSRFVIQKGWLVEQIDPSPFRYFSTKSGVEMVGQKDEGIDSTIHTLIFIK